MLQPIRFVATELWQRGLPIMRHAMIMERPPLAPWELPLVSWRWRAQCFHIGTAATFPNPTAGDNRHTNRDPTMSPDRATSASSRSTAGQFFSTTGLSSPGPSPSPSLSWSPRPAFQPTPSEPIQDGACRAALSDINPLMVPRQGGVLCNLERNCLATDDGLLKYAGAMSVTPSVCQMEKHVASGLELLLVACLLDLSLQSWVVRALCRT